MPTLSNRNMKKTSLEERIQRLEDIEEIKKLKALYCKYCDGDWQGPSHPDPDKIADLFTDDAVSETPFHPKMIGKEAHIAHYQRCQTTPFCVHWVTNPIIEITGDSATGEWWLLVASTSPANSANWTGAVYEETYLRTADGWKIKTMNLKVGFVCPYEEGWAK